MSVVCPKCGSDLVSNSNRAAPNETLVCRQCGEYFTPWPICPGCGRADLVQFALPGWQHKDSHFCARCNGTFTPEPASETAGGKEADYPRTLQEALPLLASLQAQVEQLKRERDEARAEAQRAWGCEQSKTAVIAMMEGNQETFRADVLRLEKERARKLNEANKRANHHFTAHGTLDEYQGKIEQVEADLAAARKERDSLKTILEDECETDKAVRNLARPILGDAFVDGQGYVTPLEDIAEKLIADLAAAHKELEEAKAQLSSFTAEETQLERITVERDALKTETTKLRGIIDASNQTLGMYEADNAKLREIVRLAQ